MYHKRSKIAYLLSALVVLALLLGACAPAATPEPAQPAEPQAPAQPAKTQAPAQPAETQAPAEECTEPVKITYWDGLGAPDNVPMGELVKMYNETNTDCVQVEEIVLDWGTLYTKLILDYKAGNAPDVSTMHMPSLMQYASLGILKPIEELAVKYGFKGEDFAEVVWDGAVIDGKRVAIPLDMHPFALYYNVKAFEAAGLDPDKPPTTGEEFIEYAKKLTVDADGDGTPEQYGTGLGYSGGGPFRQWMSLLWQHAGQEVLNEDHTKAAFNTPAGIESLKWLYDLVYTHKVSPPGESDPDDDFMKGIVAMNVTGPWAMGDYNKIEGLEYRTTPFPVVYDEMAVWDHPHMLVFPDSGDETKTEAAMKFVRWMVQDNNWFWTSRSGHQPVVKTVQESEEFKALENWQAFTKSLPFSNYYPQVVKSSEVFGREPTSPFVIMMESVMLDQATPEEAIATAEESVNEILAAP